MPGYSGNSFVASYEIIFEDELDRDLTDSADDGRDTPEPTVFRYNGRNREDLEEYLYQERLRRTPRYNRDSVSRDAPAFLATPGGLALEYEQRRERAQIEREQRSLAEYDAGRVVEDPDSQYSRDVRQSYLVNVPDSALSYVGREITEYYGEGDTRGEQLASLADVEYLQRQGLLAEDYRHPPQLTGLGGSYFGDSGGSAFLGRGGQAHDDPLFQLQSDTGALQGLQEEVPKGIEVTFRDGNVETWYADDVGLPIIRQMQSLAESGAGLWSYIRNNL